MRGYQVLESYKPADDRAYGYYFLPILHKDLLVGRLDPTLDRRSGVLYLGALYLEPGIEPGVELVVGVAAAIGDFMAWHAATDLQIEKSAPAAFGEKLKRKIEGGG